MTSERLSIQKNPMLRNPRLLLGFSGWMDGGEVSTGTVRCLIDKLEADRCKHIYTLPVLIGERISRYAVMGMLVLQYGLVIGLVLTRYFSWTMLLALPALYFSLPLWRMLARPRPAEPPREAEAFWPMWFVAAAFYHYRAFGILFLVGMVLQLIAA